MKLKIIAPQKDAFLPAGEWYAAVNADRKVFALFRERDDAARYLSGFPYLFAANVKVPE